jgi:SAM-dependent methyltransferase
MSSEEWYSLADHYEAQTDDIRADIAYYRRAFADGPRDLLELGTGAGRIGIPLAEEGHRVLGLDNVAEMLSRARARAARTGAASIRFVHADMRSFALERSFDAVLLPFNGLAHLHSLEDIQSCFGCVREHLRPEGRFVIDIFNPDLRYLSGRRPAEQRGTFEYLGPDGQWCSVKETTVYDEASQLNYVTWHYRCGRKRFSRTVGIRVFFPQELEALLRLGGFRVTAREGNYSGEPFHSKSPKQLFTAVPVGSPPEGP